MDRCEAAQTSAMPPQLRLGRAKSLWMHPRVLHAVATLMPKVWMFQTIGVRSGGAFSITATFCTGLATTTRPATMDICVTPPARNTVAAPTVPSELAMWSSPSRAAGRKALATLRLCNVAL